MQPQQEATLDLTANQEQIKILHNNREVSMTNEQVINAWLKGKVGAAGNLSTDGRSYAATSYASGM